MNFVDLFPVIFVVGVFAAMTGNLFLEYLRVKNARFFQRLLGTDI